MGMVFPMRMSKTGLSIVIFVISTILLIGLTGCRFFPKEEGEDVPALIQAPEDDLATCVITEGSINEEITDTAQIGSSQEKTLFFTKSGRIKEIMVESGVMVKKDQRLVSLQTDELEYSLKQAKLNLEQKQLQHQLQLDASAVAQRIAALDLERARMEYEHVSEELERSVIRAPFDGKITELEVVERDEIEAWQSIITVSAIKNMELVTIVLYDKKSHLNPGMAVKVELDDGTSGMAHIVSIKKMQKDTLNNESYKVHIRMDDPKIILKADHSYNITFIIRSVKKTLLIPNSAVRVDVNNREYLRVLEGKIRRDVYIKTGIVNETQTQVLEGAAPGMVVVEK